MSLSGRFDILPTTISGLGVLQRKPISDSRGSLERLFCSDELKILISGKRIEQINHTVTTHSGSVRGLHYQKTPYAETKFVHCLRGTVFDIAVDLRSDSPTFLRWHAEVLSANNHRTLVIPEGFAHGFQALDDECEMLYLHTEFYNQDAECGLHPQDPRLAIRWPLPVASLSPLDAARPFIDAHFSGLSV